MGCGGSTAGGGGSGGGSASGSKKVSVDLKGKGTSSLSGVKTSVQELDVSENSSLASLDGVGALVKLEKLDANSCGLTTVPAEIANCQALEELLLFANKIKELPKELGQLTSLTTINVFNNQVKKMPPECGTLANLEEVNCAANKMMMLTDAHFTAWANVKILSLYDNNLVRMGSLAPLESLEELRISGNNLEEMPTLSSHKHLSVYEIHKNRIASIPDDYFTATPALQRLSVWGNMLTALPPSLTGLQGLVGVQAQDNKIQTLPAGTWPKKLETLFLQNNPVSSLPASLGDDCKSLKRVNLTKLTLDGPALEVAGKIQSQCLSDKDGLFWGTDGKRLGA